ncbi:MAG: DMT family transporter [Chitinophagales bacterium]
MNPEKKAIVNMHIATFLFGMTAILGKLISLNEFNMVWHRMLIASVLFMFFPKFFKLLKTTPKKTIFIFLANGIIVAIHWLTFYGSIKIYNNASLTLACFGSVSLFAAILEPIILKKPFKKSEIILGLFVLFGLILLAKANPENDFSLQSNYIKAILIALVSAFLAVIFTIFNKKYIADNDPNVVTWAQMTGGFIFLTIALPFVLNSGYAFEFIPSKIDIVWLVILGFLCTNIAFALEMKALKQISAFASSIILNLEPLYGIIAAIIIFKENETLNSWFYLGAAVIVASVFIHAWLGRERN